MSVFFPCLIINLATNCGQIGRMHLARYEYRIKENFLDFSFTSSGPKGKIEKVIRYTKALGNIYNLAFGDLDAITGLLNDTAVTNNNDSSKILSTVAASIHDFLTNYPTALVLIKGSTHSRTRLYRRVITIHWNIISEKFIVYGQKEYGWELFLFEEDYSAFLVHRINL